jgi:predicted nucleotidyltransferase
MLYNQIMVDSIFAVPTIDKRQRIPEQAIKELVSRIARKFHPLQIILFGSYAYGKPTPESDVDLLVIMPTKLRESQQAMKIRQEISPLFGVDILVYSPDKLKQRISWGDSFLKEITEQGIVMYESADA